MFFFFFYKETAALWEIIVWGLVPCSINKRLYLTCVTYYTSKVYQCPGAFSFLSQCFSWFDFHLKGNVQNVSYTKMGAIFISTFKNCKKMTIVVPKFLFVLQRVWGGRDNPWSHLILLWMENFWELLLQIQGEGSKRLCFWPKGP